MSVPQLLGESLGKYRITGFLGQGGMALVFRGKQPGGEEVAIKVLPAAQAASDEASRVRFRREIEVARTLDHPNLVKVLDAGEEKATLYYVMELVQGTALDKYLETVGLPPFDHAVHVVKGVCRGLAYLHEQGLVHRDLKPGNIFLMGDPPEAILGDFGLLKPLGADDLTQTNERVGTPAYMSPEQFKGLELGPGSDIYQLGVLLYRLLAGRVPFMDPNFFKLGVMHMTKVPPRPRSVNPGIPPELEEAILRCLEKAPEARYPDAGALARDLNRYFVRKEVAKARAEGDAGAFADPERRPLASSTPVSTAEPLAPRPSLVGRWIARLVGLAAAGALLATFPALTERAAGHPLETAVGFEVAAVVLGAWHLTRAVDLAWQWQAMVAVSALHALAFLPEVASGARLAALAASEVRDLGGAVFACMEPMRAPFTYARLVHLPVVGLACMALSLRALLVEDRTRALAELAIAMLSLGAAIGVSLVLGRPG